MPSLHYLDDVRLMFRRAGSILDIDRVGPFADFSVAIILQSFCVDLVAFRVTSIL